MSKATRLGLTAWSLLSWLASVEALTFSSTSGIKAKIHESAPVAVSIEFFAFPEYVTNLSTTDQCIRNLQDVSGAATRIRIGGTTQDRATYAPDQSSPVEYYVASPADAPANLTYGPSFFDLASQLDGPTTIGLNRRLNNLSNSIQAGEKARDVMGNLYALELGNEPDLYVKSDPIANNQTWTPELDQKVQLSWQRSFLNAFDPYSNTSTNTSSIIPLIQAGVFLQPPKYSIAKLAPLEIAAGPQINTFIKSYADHAYPQSACGGASTNLSLLQDHTSIVNFVQTFAPEVAAANNDSKPIFLGETNSATCGGGGISDTFGAGLWIVDFVLQAVKLGYWRLYFHQGTIGNCAYCWWGRDTVTSPYYGAYFAAKALSNMSYIAQLDDSTSTIAAYALYRETNPNPSRLVIINSEYYTNTTSGSRQSSRITITDIPRENGVLDLKRLTAEYATTRVGQGSSPTFAGVSFENTDCSSQGAEVVEHVSVANGTAVFPVAASEAILVTW